MANLNFHELYKQAAEITLAQERIKRSTARLQLNSQELHNLQQTFWQNQNQTLKAILGEEGLGVCCSKQAHSGNDRQNQGIYPTGELSWIYQDILKLRNGEHRFQENGQPARTKQILALCREHLPKTRGVWMDQVWRSQLNIEEPIYIQGATRFIQPSPLITRESWRLGKDQFTERGLTIRGTGKIDGKLHFLFTPLEVSEVETLLPTSDTLYQVLGLPTIPQFSPKIVI